MSTGGCARGARHCFSMTTDSRQTRARPPHPTQRRLRLERPLPPNRSARPNDWPPQPGSRHVDGGWQRRRPVAVAHESSRGREPQGTRPPACARRSGDENGGKSRRGRCRTRLTQPHMACAAGGATARAPAGPFDGPRRVPRGERFKRIRKASLAAGIPPDKRRSGPRATAQRTLCHATSWPNQGLAPPPSNFGSAPAVVPATAP